MTKLQSVDLSAVLAITALFVAPLVASRLNVNVAPSVPIGNYRIEHGAPDRGDFVLIALSPNFRGYAIACGDLRAHHRLLKRVVAMDGEHVWRRGIALWFNSHVSVWLRRTDGSGRALPRWRGCRHLRIEEACFGRQSI